MKKVLMIGLTAFILSNSNASILSNNTESAGSSDEVEAIKILSIRHVEIKEKQDQSNKDLHKAASEKEGAWGSFVADVVNDQATKTNGVKIKYIDAHKHSSYISQLGKVCNFKKGAADLTYQTVDGKKVAHIEPNAECPKPKDD
jgi:hypothetical protein